MEVKIGVQHAPRELVLESGQSHEDIEKAVTAAFKSPDGVLTLVDDKGRRVLVVEDDYFLAADLGAALEAQGAQVLGPVPSMADVLHFLTAEPALDAALLDINLGGEMVFPVADLLQGRGVPFAFVTGYEAWTLPNTYAHIPRFEKPVNLHQVVRWLLG